MKRHWPAADLLFSSHLPGLNATQAYNRGDAGVLQILPTEGPIKRFVRALRGRLHRWFALRQAFTMLVSHEREKLCEAIVFFAINTRKLGKTKLFKLLYFLDFEHFKLRGRSVTGLNYFAWPKGPVPKSLFEEFEHPGEDLAACAEFSQIPTLSGGMNKVTAVKLFDPKVFSKRELSILKSLAERYRDATASDMVEETHLENRPWHQIYEVKGRRQSEIPYELALNRQEIEEMKRQVRERQEVIKNYKNDKDDGSRNNSF